MDLNRFADDVFAVLPVRKKTLATYRSMYRCHIESTLGHLELDAITRSDIKSCIAGLPSQTSATTLAVIKMLFREAIENGVIEKSPVHGVRGPRVMVQPRRFLTWEELQRINFGKYNHQIQFLALHGLRWSEAVALTNDDIRDGRIYITKSVHGPTKKYCWYASCAPNWRFSNVSAPSSNVAEGTFATWNNDPFASTYLRIYLEEEGNSRNDGATLARTFRSEGDACGLYAGSGFGV